ncbi:hypothetical protein [Robertmurraya andreesenii]|uniref:Uncharacterized protein n=1 Tax=Anoxybacillus andreesenii TaxID=1325932 RepID=A0ABT9V9C5_9BACL|nr:hypothetical protein [Robertmurraya andreesenii]MDQ0157570.1 hypothetical protein [Robertmurraya andreesenii]
MATEQALILFLWGARGPVGDRTSSYSLPSGDKNAYWLPNTP